VSRPHKIRQQDSRIGYSFLYAGCGYGGSCLPKDVTALIRSGEACGHPLRILNAVAEVNEAQRHVLTARIVRRFGEDLTGRHFAVWGLAFKPNTDDMREAPSRVLIADLLQRGATIAAYDPVAMAMAMAMAMAEAGRVFAGQEGLAGLAFAPNPLAACEGADALVIVTEWKEFRSPDFEGMKRALKSPLVFDGRNVFDPEFVRHAGLEYFGIGRR